MYVCAYRAAYVHKNTVYCKLFEVENLTWVNEPRKFSSEFEVPCPSAKLFHLERFAIYDM